MPKLPLDFPALTDPLDLEIGAGQGLHAIRYAQAHPERTLLAVERTHTKYHGLATRRAHHPELTNLHALHADAVSIVTHVIPPGRLARVFLLYPNPYPKPKQANLRFHNQPFIEELKAKMRPGAELIFATNLAWLAEEAAARMPLTLKSQRTLSPEDVPRTHFEKKYLARGESCFDLVFTRSE